MTVKDKEDEIKKMFRTLIVKSVFLFIVLIVLVSYALMNHDLMTSIREILALYEKAYHDNVYFRYMTNFFYFTLPVYFFLKSLQYAKRREDYQ